MALVDDSPASVNYLSVRIYNMSRFSQFDFNSGSSRGQGSLLGRAVAFAAGITVLGIAVFVGAVFIAAVIGLALLGSVFFLIRLWWLKRKMEQYQAEHGDLDAEYTVVIDKPTQIGRTNKRDGG